MSARTRGKQRKQGQRRGNGQTLIPHPPPVQDIGLKREVRVRMLCTAAFSGQITYQNLLDIYNLATSAVTATALYTAVKVKAIEVWANGLTNSSATVTILFDGAVLGAIGDQKIHTDSSMGIEPAHVRAVPGRMTQAAQFQEATANNAFRLICPIGAVLDLELSYRNPLIGSVVATQNAPAGASPGAVFVRGMDGVAAAGSSFLPVGPFAID
jgi:hypothetical protein